MQRKGLALAESLTAGARRNAEAQSELARARAALGHIYAEMAKDDLAPPERRIERLLVARSWYQSGLNLWIDLQQRGWLRKRYSDQPDKLSRSIADCDETLKRLQSRVGAAPQ
jgi:hypothetical protein